MRQQQLRAMAIGVKFPQRLQVLIGKHAPVSNSILKPQRALSISIWTVSKFGSPFIYCKQPREVTPGVFFVHQKFTKNIICLQN